MNRADAENLWGSAAVMDALSSRASPIGPELLSTTRRRAAGLDDKDFARWALTLPWPAFCAVVRLVAGVTRAELLTMGEIRE